jgi:hypothetical protein
VVIGEKFAWGHLRKTGGDATLNWFQLFPELIESADPKHREDKHRPFTDRERQIEGKLLVCNIRRLPSVVLSWSHHVNHWGHKGFPAAMKSPHEMSQSSKPDAWLSAMTDKGRFRVARWLRWENLAADFVAFITQFAEVTDEKRDRILEPRRVNALIYDHEVTHWFSEEQIGQLYENNPIWASAEREAYENPD